MKHNPWQWLLAGFGAAWAAAVVLSLAGLLYIMATGLRP